MADTYTTTPDPLRPMICLSCGGHFAGNSVNEVDGGTYCVHCLGIK